MADHWSSIHVEQKASSIDIFQYLCRKKSVNRAIFRDKNNRQTDSHTLYIYNHFVYNKYKLLYNKVNYIKKNGITVLL